MPSHYQTHGGGGKGRLQNRGSRGKSTIKKHSCLNSIQLQGGAKEEGGPTFQYLRRGKGP